MVTIPKYAVYALNFLIYWAYTVVVYFTLPFILGFIEGFSGSHFNFNIIGLSGAIAIVSVIIFTAVYSDKLYIKRV